MHEPLPIDLKMSVKLSKQLRVPQWIDFFEDSNYSKILEALLEGKEIPYPLNFNNPFYKKSYFIQAYNSCYKEKKLSFSKINYTLYFRSISRSYK